jgi:death-on-curing protein
VDEIQFNYFDIEHAIAVHDHIIERSGGLHGIRDQGVLESVLDHIQNDGYYPSFESKLTHLFFSVNKLHAFTDGNKRSGILLSAFFLEINGFEHCIKLFVQEMENIAVWVADGAVSKDLLQKIIHDLVLCDELLESTKLEFTMAIIEHQNQMDEGS